MWSHGFYPFESAKRSGISNFSWLFPLQRNSFKERFRNMQLASYGPKIAHCIVYVYTLGKRSGRKSLRGFLCRASARYHWTDITVGMKFRLFAILALHEHPSAVSGSFTSQKSSNYVQLEQKHLELRFRWVASVWWESMFGNWISCFAF